MLGSRLLVILTNLGRLSTEQGRVYTRQSGRRDVDWHSRGRRDKGQPVVLRGRGWLVVLLKSDHVITRVVAEESERESIVSPWELLSWAKVCKGGTMGS